MAAARGRRIRRCAALCLGGAGLLASLALLGQSRGWVLAVPLALLLWLAISPRRVRAADRRRAR